MKALKILSLVLILGVLSFDVSASYVNQAPKTDNSVNFIKDNGIFSEKEKINDLVAEKNKPEANLILEVILCFLLPPLAVFLHSGIGTPFWINLILTLLFWLPGIIHGLLVVFDVI